MTSLLEPLWNGLQGFDWRDVIDIVIVAVVFYFIFKMISKTRAMRVMIGLAVILVLAWVFSLLQFNTVNWLLTWLLNAGAVLIVVLFQPEIRRALEKLGRGKWFGALQTAGVSGTEYLIEAFSRAILNMSKHKVGAIIVFERKTGLNDVLESGTMLNASVSSELIENIFYPNTPLHDGAMIVRDGKIVAAGCFLPLSDNKQIASDLGTRHRAALGISEISDAYVLVVSEEKGIISYMYDGTLTRFVDAKALKEILSELYAPVDDKEKKTYNFKFKRKVGDDE